MKPNKLDAAPFLLLTRNKLNMLAYVDSLNKRWSQLQWLQSANPMNTTAVAMMTAAATRAAVGVAIATPSPPIESFPIKSP